MPMDVDDLAVWSLQEVDGQQGTARAGRGWAMVATGIHGDDPKKVYAELCEVIEDVLAHLESEGRPMRAPKVRPMQEVV